MKDIEFLKEMYYYQVNQKQQISSSVNIPIGIIGLVIGGFVYLLNNLGSIDNNKKYVISIIMITFAFFISFTCCFLIKAIWRNKYMYLPRTEEIMKHKMVLTTHYEEHSEYYINNGQLNKETFVQNEFEKYLCVELIKCTDQNNETNEKRLNNIRRATTFLILTLIIGSISLIAYTYSVTDDSEAISSNNRTININIKNISIDE